MTQFAARYFDLVPSRGTSIATVFDSESLHAMYGTVHRALINRYTHTVYPHTPTSREYNLHTLRSDLTAFTDCSTVLR